MSIRKRKVEVLTQQLLADQRITAPPVPVSRLAKASGTRIYLQSLDSEISGFLYRDDKQTVIGVNTHHPLVRQRFTIAHELGHALLHDQEEMHDEVHVDHAFKVRLRDDASSKGSDEEEKEANLFAAELLMPSHFLRKDLKSIPSVDISDDKTLKALAKKYGVSLQALVFRLTNLGYLSA